MPGTGTRTKHLYLAPCPLEHPPSGLQSPWRWSRHGPRSRASTFSSSSICSAPPWPPPASPLLSPHAGQGCGRGGAGGTQLWVLSPRPWCAPSLALSSLSKHTEAVVYYKKALELDPDNETYKSNLRIAELKLREAPSPVSRPRE